ncbi:MAG TPA: isoprenylcysteine carboxylmethyltransferase family protein [Chitinispirillaceae bacterium]|nr:isoprenylcysteine carboxylmethyltransferase family protein [Chitinispirillaceae bacterium]
MKQKMSIFGIGPLMAICVFPVLIVTIITTIKNGDLFVFYFIPKFYLAGAAAFLISAGLILHTCAVAVFMPGFKAGKLVVNGVYSLCRNPFYSSWILFIIPGISLAFNSWILVLNSVALYIAFKILIGNESKMLAEVFGEVYLSYKSNTRELLPFPKAKNKNLE